LKTTQPSHYAPSRMSPNCFVCYIACTRLQYVLQIDTAQVLQRGALSHSPNNAVVFLHTWHTFFSVKPCNASFATTHS